MSLHRESRRRRFRPHGLLAAVAFGLLGALSGVLLGLLPAAPAQAHAQLLSTEPADGAASAQAPAELLLHFNEPVELPPEAVRVFDADGERVDTDARYGPHRSVVRAPLPPDLPDGGYVVAWRVISADTHPIHGSFTFTVGTPVSGAPPLVVPVEEASAGWSAVAAVVRWLGYAGTLLAIGGAVFLVLVHDRTPTERDRLVRMVGYAAAAGAAGALLGIPLQTVLTSGVGADALTDRALLAETITTGYGGSALLRLAGLTVLFVAVVNRWLSGRATAVALAAGLATLASFLFAGHTATGEPRALVVGANLLHSGATAVWLGGLLSLLVVLRSRRAAAAPAVGGAAMVARFSLLATVAVVAVAASGTALGWSEIRSLDGLTGTAYGWLLLTKVVLVAVVVAIGGYNQRRLVPAIRLAEAEAEAEAPAAGAVVATAGWRRLRRTVQVESAVLLVAVLGVTAVLVDTAPPPAPGQPAASAPTEPVTAVAALGDHRVTVRVEPAEAGENKIRVEVQTADGAPADLAEEVELRFHLPAAEIERISRQAEPGGPGEWLHHGPELAIPGDWEIEVRVLVSDFELRVATVGVPVSAPVEGAR